MTIQIFIDGQAGTTGLQVADKLANHEAVSLIEIAHEDRKNEAVKKEAYAAADVAILCLPDSAAKAAAAMAQDFDVVLIDASTAHRTDPDWVYGMAELSAGQREAIAETKRISNPGCYPTGFLSLVRPLREAGLLDEASALTIPAVSGYTGGGNGLIDAFAAKTAPVQFSYGHGLAHKHVPEMMKMAALTTAPIFMPSVGDFAQGMLVHVPLHQTQLAKQVTGSDIAAIYQSYYENSALITAYDANDSEQLHDAVFLAADALAGTDRLEVFTHSDDEAGILWLTARLDNLGKGASGAAIQNMNIAMGLDETAGLSL